MQGPGNSPHIARSCRTANLNLRPGGSINGEMLS